MQYWIKFSFQIGHLNCSSKRLKRHYVSIVLLVDAYIKCSAARLNEVVSLEYESKLQHVRKDIYLLDNVC